MIKNNAFLSYKYNRVLLITIILIVLMVLCISLCALFFNRGYVSSVGLILSSDSKTATKTVANVVLSDSFTESNILNKLDFKLGTQEVQDRVNLIVRDDAFVIYIVAKGKTADEALELAEAYHMADYSYVSKVVKGCGVTSFSKPSEPVREAVDSQKAWYMVAGITFFVIMLIYVISRIKSTEIYDVE